MFQLKASERSIDTGLAEAGLLDDRRHCLAQLTQVSNLPHPVIGELALATELHAAVLGFGDAVHLALTPDVVLELGNQGLSAVGNSSLQMTLRGHSARQLSVGF